MNYNKLLLFTAFLLLQLQGAWAQNTYQLRLDRTQGLGTSKCFGTTR